MIYIVYDLCEPVQEKDGQVAGIPFSSPPTCSFCRIKFSGIRIFWKVIRGRVEQAENREKFMKFMEKHEDNILQEEMIFPFPLAFSGAFFFPNSGSII